MNVQLERAAMNFAESQRNPVSTGRNDQLRIVEMRQASGPSLACGQKQSLMYDPAAQRDVGEIMLEQQLVHICPLTLTKREGILFII